MSAAGWEPHEALIRELTAELRPVRRLWSPPWRTAVWAAVLVVAAGGLACVSDLHAIWLRLTGASDMWLAVVGSVVTALTAGLAAFELSLPDRSRAWALLPLPGLALWLGASGMGCLRTTLIPAARMPTMGEESHCLMFIVGVSVPLSLLLLAMLWRARPLRPGPVAAMGGLAAAAAAASLLSFIHPYDVAASDLVFHTVAVGIVILIVRALGGRALGAPTSSGSGRMRRRG
ncbi:MAG TPA: NrsF family protein [Acetobacteraceae bacterium]|nr:NrsF family protein [Acetobacteraceae bacterium]